MRTKPQASEYQILIWRIGESFTKSPKLIPPNTRNRARDSVQRGRMRRTCIRQIKICQ